MRERIGKATGIAIAKGKICRFVIQNELPWTVFYDSNE